MYFYTLPLNYTSSSSKFLYGEPERDPAYFRFFGQIICFFRNYFQVFKTTLNVNTYINIGHRGIFGDHLCHFAKVTDIDPPKM